MKYSRLPILRRAHIGGRASFFGTAMAIVSCAIFAAILNSCGSDDESTPILQEAQTQDQGQLLSLVIAGSEGITLNQSLAERISGVRISVELSCANVISNKKNRRRLTKRIENYLLGEIIYLTASINCEDPRLSISKLSFRYTTVNEDEKLVRLTENFPTKKFRGNSVSLNGTGPSAHCEYFLTETIIHSTPEATIALDPEKLL